jgi:hypothetical protein
METFTEYLSFGSQMQLPTLTQDQLVEIQQTLANVAEQSLLTSKDQLSSNFTDEIQIKAQNLADLIKRNKEQACMTINQLVSSAQAMTANLTSSLTAVPAHPYERLVYDYLGPNFVCPSIKDLTIPADFTPQKCLADIEQISKNISQLQTSQFARLSTEVLDTSFYGITSENLNNAFAILSSTDRGDQYVLESNKISNHLQFIETVKAIPTNYILENPIEVAKKMLTEFVRLNS